MPDLAEVSIEEEFNLVTDYLGIEKQISGGRIDYRIHLPEALKTCPIIPLCILTLAENAVKHGLSPKKEGGSVRISIAHETDALDIRVEDNGVGFDVEKMNRGFGLYSIQKRLELHYKGLASLNIESNAKDFTCVSIRIPYDKS
ncbi:MAG: ATP-binding protein, partial [Desulfobacterales bacterium]|nr:ATP-binding protein [Desulfobacterales bacterium]